MGVGETTRPRPTPPPRRGAEADVDAEAGEAGEAGAEAEQDLQDRSRTIRVLWTASAVARARRSVVLDLQRHGLDPEIVSEAEIVVSELAANAIRHARPLPDGSIRVRWTVKAGVVEIEVSDGGGTSTPRPAPLSVWAPSGRGLRIVRSLAHEWGVTDDRHGRTVWAALGGPSRRRSH